MNRVTIPMVDKFKCDGIRKLAASINMYNEKECLPIALESLKDFPVVFVSDGKWERLKDLKANKEGLSYDGSREIALSFPNVVLIDCGNCKEETQSNTAMRAAALYGYDFLFQLATDEYIKGDYNKLQENIIKTKKKYKDYNLFFVKFEIVHITPPTQKYSEVARIISNPMFVRLKNIHWIYFFSDKRTEMQKIVDGVVIYHDDKPRNDERERQMKQYQDWNVPREQELLDKMSPEELRVINMGLVKMWKEIDFPPTIGLHGDMYWNCGCIKIKGEFTSLCNRHKIKRPPEGEKGLRDHTGIITWKCGCKKVYNGFDNMCEKHLKDPSSLWYP